MLGADRLLSTPMTDPSPVAAAGPFTVHLDVYDGPFDLLLGLISKHQLDVTEVALSKVTDDFIAHIRAQGSAWDLGVATEFLVVAATLLDLQRALYIAMSEVGTPASDLGRLPRRIDATAIAELEEHAAALRATVDIAARFIIPGEDELSARLDLARAVARRAERRVVALADTGQLDGEHLLPWLNRLSDVLFVLSRAVEPGARPAREGS